MYCSGCGTEIESDLNFCKRCGMRIGRGESQSIAENLSSSLGYIGGFGLVGFMLGAFMLVKAGISDGALTVISVAYLLALLGICFLILRQTGSFTLKRNLPPNPANETQAPAYLRPTTTAQLEPSTQEPISIVEHTTKSLEEVKRK